MMNIFVYLGMNLAISAEGEQLEHNVSFKLKGDLMDKLLIDTLDPAIVSMKDNFTDYDLDFESNFTTFPETLGGQEIGDGGVSFIDVINMVIPFFKTVFNVMISPLTLFTSSRLPPIIVILIGIPYLIIGVMSVILAIRGVGD